MIPDSTALANQYNTYFVDIGQTIIAELGLDDVSCVDFEELECDNSLFLKETNEHKVTETTGNLKLDSAAY